MTSITVERLFNAFRIPGNRQEVIALLSSFPDQSEIKNIKDRYDFYERYLIHHAAAKGWTDVIELLITKYNCDPNCTDCVERTSLHWACASNRLPTVKLLTNQYCLDPLQVASGVGRSPLYYSSGETEEYLLQLMGK